MYLTGGQSYIALGNSRKMGQHTTILKISRSLFIPPGHYKSSEQDRENSVYCLYYYASKFILSSDLMTNFSWKIPKTGVDVCIHSSGVQIPEM